MKFGRILEKLKENPIFRKYFKDTNFLPYKKLKNIITVLPLMPEYIYEFINFY